MEVFYDFERKGDIQKADISQEYYVDWTETKENKLLDEIESYNQQDCESTYELHKWLLNIKPPETNWNELYEEDIELNEWDISNQSLREDILNSSIDDDLKQLLHDVVGFYRRENRIAYRNIFERSLKGHDELIDDAECIANMKKSNEEPEIENRSYLIKYNYEDQDFKRKKLDTVNLVNELDSEGKPYIYAGIITEIDYSTKSVFLKRSMSKENTSPLPEIISIGPGKPRNPTKFELSTNNFIIQLLITKANIYQS